MGRTPTSGGVTPKGDRIQIRFSWQGAEYRPTLDMKPTAANLKHAVRLRDSILSDIRSGTFNMTEYFPEYRFADKISNSSDTLGRTFKDWCAVWAELASRSLEHSTLTIYKQHLDAYWVSKFGGEMPKAITNERILRHLAHLSRDREDGKPLSRKTQNNIMIPLRGVFALICRADKALRNPLNEVKNLKTQGADPDPFSPEEVEDILKVLNKDYGPEVADFFEFAFFAGLRPSEQIALLWPDVDLRSGLVRVRRARVRGKDKESTKTHYARDVELNTRALQVLERQRARTQVVGAHVFHNPVTRKAWTDFEAQRRIWVLALRSAKIRYRPPKECRDTSVTMSLMAGADPAWVAKQHGHSITVMQRDYAKWVPNGDGGRNLAVINSAIGSTNSALEPHLTVNEKC